jgi:hypothetical protein
VKEENLKKRLSDDGKVIDSIRIRRQDSGENREKPHHT